MSYKSDGQIHTKRLSYIAEEIEGIQSRLLHTILDIKELDKFNDEHRKFMEPELKAREKRLRFELQKNIDALILFTEELKSETKMYPKTECSNCGTVSTNQPEGDGCHACLAGIMENQ